MISQIVITTEKPSVAREYAKTLRVNNKQDGFIEGYSDVLSSWVKITWCVGHLCTLSYPEAYDEELKNWSMDTLPFLPREYKYEVISEVKKQFQVVKACLNDIGTDKENKRIESLCSEDSGQDGICRILYAGDSAREGLYIQMLVRQIAGSNKKADERIVWIDSFTESEILKGISTAKPLSAYDNQTKAAYIRAIEDYMLGINFSRALTLKYGYAYKQKAGLDKGVIAVGRVMTCVLAMIVERERQIRDFKETSFYKIAGVNGDITANWKSVEGSSYFNSPLLYDEYGFKEKKDADELRLKLSADKKVTLSKLNKNMEKKYAPLLFNLAEIQNFCSNKYKISPDQTLEIVQSLYEKKLTTYPRTDARVMSTAVAKEIGKTLNGLYGLNYKQQEMSMIAKNKWHIGFEKFKRYVDDSKISDHYAIIPTGYINGADSLSELENKIYHDIIDRFLSVFYPPAVYNKIEAEFIHSDGEKLFANDKYLVEPGYLVILGTSDEDKIKSSLSGLSEGSKISFDFEVKEGKTQPPKRYTSGSIVIAMENAGKLIEDEELRAQIKGNGIGTSATRAETIKKLIKNKYIDLNKKTQVLTPLVPGECVYDIVKDTIPELLKPEMTASWERGLGKIESGEITDTEYRSKLEQYVTQIIQRIKEKEGSGMGSYSGSVKGSPLADIKCPVCQKGSVTENSKAFGCSEYKNGCKFVIWKNIAGKMISASDAAKLLTKGKTGLIKGFKGKSGKSFDAILKYENGEIKFDFGQKK